MKPLPKCGIDTHVYLANEEREKRKKIIEEARKNNITHLNKILVDICKVFNLDVEIVKSGDSHGGTVMVRKIFYYIVRTKTKTGYKTMAKITGRKDHCSCIRHIRKVRGFLEVKDPEFMNLWNHYLTNSKLYTKNDFI